VALRGKAADFPRVGPEETDAANRQTEAQLTMGRLVLQASSGLATTAGHRHHWAACHRRGRSLPRRIVQAVLAGAWRQVKRLSSLVVHSWAARTVAVTRVTENAGKKPPGVDGDRWTTPAKKAHAVARIGRWQGSRSAPLRRVYLPKKHGQHRPLSLPTLTDRARQAVSLQAWQPVAETTAEQHSDGVRPQRRGADALDQCVKVLRQQSSATWILAGDIPGLFDHLRFAWIEAHSPMTRRRLSKWLRSGFLDRGPRCATTAGVPPGGSISPTGS
jgi:RNA-directed DNA polymerase